GPVYGAADDRRVGRRDNVARGRAYLRAGLRFGLAASAVPATALRERGEPRPDRPDRAVYRDDARRDHPAAAGARRLGLRRGRRAAGAHVLSRGTAALDAATPRLVGRVQGSRSAGEDV